MKLNTILFFTLFLALPLQGAISQEEFSRRIAAHLLIQDHESAVKEGKLAIEEHPDSCLLYESYIKSLALAGKSNSIYDEWLKFSKKFPDKAYNHDLLEEICFGIVQKGLTSPALNIRTIALIGIALTQDVRAVKALAGALHDPNAHIRAIAAPLAGHYGDDVLRKELLRLLNDEKKLKVRLEAIGSIGKLKMHEALPHLYELLSSGATTEEKIKAVVAIVNIEDTLSDDKIQFLATQPQASFRLLACEAISVLQKKESKLMQKLLYDNSPAVRKAAIKAAVTCHVNDEITKKAFGNSLHSTDPEVKMIAAWGLLLFKDPGGERTLEHYLRFGSPQDSLLAVGAIRSAGPFGLNIARKWLGRIDSSFIEANLALACLEQRVEIEKCCKIIDQFFQNSKEQWMDEEVADGAISYLKKGNAIHNELIPNLPEATNQITRLKVLNLLSLLGYPRSQEMIKEFLKEKRWGISGIAAELLLEEGDTSAIDLIRELLNEDDPEMKVQAALALAILGRDDSSLPVLTENYAKADWQLKVKILEACGRIGDPKCIPFLVGNLGHPSETLRMITAAVLLQTLFH